MFDFIIWNYVEFQANTTIYLLNVAIYFGLIILIEERKKKRQKGEPEGGFISHSTHSLDLSLNPRPPRCLLCSTRKP